MARLCPRSPGRGALLRGELCSVLGPSLRAARGRQRRNPRFLTEAIPFFGESADV